MFRLFQSLNRKIPYIYITPVLFAEFISNLIQEFFNFTGWIIYP